MRDLRRRLRDFDDFASPPACFVCGAVTGGRAYLDGDVGQPLGLCLDCRPLLTRAGLLDSESGFTLQRALAARATFASKALGSARRRRGKATG